MEGEASSGETSTGQGPAVPPEGPGSGAPSRPILETTARPLSPPPRMEPPPFEPPPAPPPPPPPFSEPPRAAPPPPPIGPTSGGQTSGDAGWHILCHVSALLAFCLGLATPVANALGLVFPLVVWQLKDPDDEALGATAKDVFDFQLNILVLSLATLLCTCCIGAVCLPIFQIANVVLTILAAVRAANGKPYRYPVMFRALA